eukprot:CAMPEP_0184855152 /NCGR_PEP_ID=MMETSP0580-20130426/467_1 /TAXON_ID=1118495 /ORGANISM="Dactyliosolen fragilissimus" /LENGTH=191 /DNA_ID=CAMNT_0027349593 /DNA_START=662 /DNA_END=1237 /DNA_ORIENTATION=-
MGLVIYALGMVAWEATVGVTTPIETAAGIAFGFTRAAIASACAKVTGAVIAFCLGRYLLAERIQAKLEGNEYATLMQESFGKNPIGVALIWRFSFLPEFVKNFGLALQPLKIWQFAVAVILHGVPFTLLWSFMGNEMGLVLRGTVSQPSKILKILLGGVYVFGFFISPSLVGLWIKSLRENKKSANISQPE